MTTVLIIPTLLARAKGWFDELSQIEARNNDNAFGRHRELSRYQILPEFWEWAWTRNDPAIVPLRPTDFSAAGNWVNWIMDAGGMTNAGPSEI